LQGLKGYDRSLIPEIFRILAAQFVELWGRVGLVADEQLRKNFDRPPNSQF